MSDLLDSAGDGALVLPAASCLALCRDLPRAADLDAAMGVVDQVRRDLVGEGLLTINLDVSRFEPALEPDTIVLQRIWTSDPVAYPVAGRKHKRMTAWTRQLLRSAEHFVAEGDAALAQVFDDRALIASLGLRAVVNVPLLDDRGGCFATFNALGTRPFWQPQEVLALRLLGALSAPAVRRAAELHFH